MNDQQFAQILRDALPEYERQMYTDALPEFMCHVLERRHYNIQLSIFEFKEAKKRISDRIHPSTTLHNHLNNMCGREADINAGKQRMINFWYEWIKELETEQQPAPLPTLPAPKIKTYKKVANIEEIMEELHKHSPKVQARVLKAYMHELDPEDKGVFMCTKEFSKWCRDNIHHIEESLKEDD